MPNCQLELEHSGLVSWSTLTIRQELCEDAGIRKEPELRIEERIGARLARARREQGWTQEYLGEYLAGSLGRKWSKQTVSAAEGGGRSFVAEELLTFCLVFSKPLGWFFEPDISQIGEQIQFSSGLLIDDQHIRRATGTPLQEAVNLATLLRELAKQVESLNPAAEVEVRVGPPEVPTSEPEDQEGVRR
jgi:transcriptional regulator with XRE-family HTH domain